MMMKNLMKKRKMKKKKMKVMTRKMMKTSQTPLLLKVILRVKRF